MKKIVQLLVIIILLTSCAKLKENIEIRKYDGYWKLVSLETTYYDTLGKVSSTTTIDTIGSLKLSKEGDFRATGISELNTVGKWLLSYYGKKDMILFDEIRATTDRKSKNKLEIEFTLGDNQGRLVSVKKYFLEFEKKIDYKDEKDVKYGISFKDAGGKEHFYESNGIVTTTETNFLTTKYKTSIDFINTKEADAVYKFIRIIIIGDENGFSNTNYTWSGSWSSNVISSFQFWDDGTNSSGIIYASSASDLNITANDLVNQTSVKGNIQTVDFSSTIPSLGTNKFTDIVIDVAQ